MMDIHRLYRKYTGMNMYLGIDFQKYKEFDRSYDYQVTENCNYKSIML